MPLSTVTPMLVASTLGSNSSSSCTSCRSCLSLMKVSFKKSNRDIIIIGAWTRGVLMQINRRQRRDAGRVDLHQTARCRDPHTETDCDADCGERMSTADGRLERQTARVAGQTK